MNKKEYEFDVNRQFRRIFFSSGVVSAINFLITLSLALPLLPGFYLISSLFFLSTAKHVSLRNFVPAFSLSFLIVVIQSFLSVYVLGDDCGIQLYLLALLIPSNYIRMTEHTPAFQRRFIIGVCCACVLCYLLSDEIIDYFITPLTYVDNLSELFFTFINVLGSLTLLVYVSSIFALGYQKEFQVLVKNTRLLEKEARQDGVTGLQNRRGIQPFLARKYKEWERTDTPFTVAIGDIDHFKHFNDTYGHEAGDAVLKQLGQLVTEQLPPFAQVCRWGGEEFLFAFPTSLETSVSYLEKLRIAINRMPISYQGNTLQISMTIGVASADQTVSLAQMIRLADQRLYDGKQRGRNQTVYHSTSG